MRGIAYGRVLVAGNGPWGSKTARNVADNNPGGPFSGGTVIGVTGHTIKSSPFSFPHPPSFAFMPAFSVITLRLPTIIL